VLWLISDDAGADRGADASGPGPRGDPTRHSPCRASRRVASQIGDDGTRPILSIQTEQGALLRELVQSRIAPDGRERAMQFLPVEPIASIAERAEPLVGVSEAQTAVRVRTTSPRLRPVQPGAQTSSNRRKAGGRSGLLGKARWRAATRRPSMSKTSLG